MKTQRTIAAFTLVEVLVASGIVVLIMGVLLTMTDQTQRLVRSTSSKVEQFQDARVGFEAMTRRLAQATLNTFWDYQYDQDGIPIRYERAAELRFRSAPARSLISSRQDRVVGHAVFFQAPMGVMDNPGTYGRLDHLLNTWGYFVEVAVDTDELPAFLRGKLPERKRYRLMEVMQPAESLRIYSQAAQEPTSRQWFESVFQIQQNNPPVRVLTENIVALVILPRLSLADEQQWMRDNGQNRPPVLAPLYSYDTTQGIRDRILNPKNQLPPVVQVVMLAIDEASAQRLQDDPKYGGDQFLGISYDPDPFSGRPLFRDPRQLEDDRSTGSPGDISRLEKLLISRKVSYRVFATNVSIRGAKWSRGQEN
jgi:uncharacterized protein (TIGR02599 family)